MENKLVVEYVKKVSTKTGKVYTALEIGVVKDNQLYPVKAVYADDTLNLALNALGIKCVEKF